MFGPNKASDLLRNILSGWFDSRREAAREEARVKRMRTDHRERNLLALIMPSCESRLA